MSIKCRFDTNNPLRSLVSIALFAMLGWALALPTSAMADALNGGAASDAAAKPATPPIPIRFNLPEDGEVTLVIENADGKRVRNLISQTPFPKGDNVVWWDGTNDLGRDTVAADHGLYLIPPQLVSPGSYTVRGLWHRPLDLRYQMTVYSPGNPPWPTIDGTGGWMTNHTPASSLVFLPGDKAPGGQPLVYIGAYISEGGSALSWVDLNGKKINGRGWIGGNWTGAQYLARDAGPTAVKDIYAYVGAVRQELHSPVEIRLTGLTPSGDRPILKPVFTFDYTGSDVETTLGGLTVYNGMLAVSQPALNRLIFVDVKEGRVLSTPSLPSPRGLIFDTQGRLLALSGKSLLRFSLEDLPQTLQNPEILAADLDDPQGITIDASENIYVSDQGASHQVKVFSPAGKPITTFGKPGAPKGGPYDPLHMNDPKGLAVDSNGRLWVAEDSFQPKRVSIWNPDGTLWQAFYGPPQYGGGGSLDPQDKTRFRYDGMEFRLDWQAHTSTLTRIFDVSESNNFLVRPIPGMSPKPPETPVDFDGRHYLTNEFNSSPTLGQDIVFLFLDDGKVATPVASIGRASGWDLLKGEAFKSRWPTGAKSDAPDYASPAFFIWSDLNDDGQVQPEEVTIAPGFSGGITVDADGSFLVAHLGDGKTAEGKAMRFSPMRFTGGGAPVYDITAGKVIAPSQKSASDGGDQILAGTDGWTVQTTAPPPFSAYGLGGSRNGVPQWSYPSLWPGLHPSHNSPQPDGPGMLIGATHLLGGLIDPKNSTVGPLFFMNGNQGNIYVFTQDGLFVAQLFHDSRQGKLWQMPIEAADMSLNDLTLHDEDFFPSVTQTTDGKVYLDAGAIPALVRIDGLETLRAITPIKIQVTPADIEKARSFTIQSEIARQKTQGTGILPVALMATPPSLDGRPKEWSGVTWAEIDHRGVAAFFNSNTKPYDINGALAVADGKLYAAWITNEPNLLKNSGAEPTAPFKTGGALDLMLGTDPNADPARTKPAPGDVRLLITEVKGKTKALLYRAVAPGTAADQRIAFSAPAHSISFDRVDDISDQVHIASDGLGGYEIAVPLSVIGLEPKPLMKIKGDIGVLKGDGVQTTQRVYWNNKATAIVSDVPSEAELTPNLWGVFQFDSASAKAPPK